MYRIRILTGAGVIHIPGELYASLRRAIVRAREVGPDAYVWSLNGHVAWRPGEDENPNDEEIES